MRSRRPRKPDSRFVIPTAIVAAGSVVLLVSGAVVGHATGTDPNALPEVSTAIIKVKGETRTIVGTLLEERTVTIPGHYRTVRGKTIYVPPTTTQLTGPGVTFTKPGTTITTVRTITGPGGTQTVTTTVTVQGPGQTVTQTDTIHDTSTVHDTVTDTQTVTEVSPPVTVTETVTVPT